MDLRLYEAPVRIELKGSDLYVNGKLHPRSVRTLAQMAGVYASEPDLGTKGGMEMYHMYRGIHVANGIRYDITVIPALAVGNECNKTYGHYHPEASPGLGFPEVYQVLRGSAVFILQKKNRDGGVSVSIIKSSQGECLFIPPNCGHVTVNPGGEALVLGNAVADGWDSDYSEYGRDKGAAVYYQPDGSIVQNNHYVIKDMERADTAKFNARTGFFCRDLLADFFKDPLRFNFLKKPAILIKKSE